MRVLRSLIALSALTLVAACGGLGGEPVVVATIPPQPTARPTAAILATIVTTPAAQAPTPSGTEEVRGPTTPATPAGTAQATIPTFTGTVTGKLTMGTAGATLAPDTDIQLVRLNPAPDAQTTFTTKADANGNYLFKDIPMAADAEFGVAATYKGRAYGSQVGLPDHTTKTLDLPVTVYEPTADASVLKITNVTLAIATGDTGLEIAQIMRFTNASDRAYSTDQAANGAAFRSIKVNLPPGATVIGFNEGDQRYVVEGHTVYDSAPVLPGVTHAIHVIYSVPYSAVGSDFQIKLDYAFAGDARLSFMQADIEATATVGDVSLGKAASSTGAPSYTATVNVPAGSAFNFTVKAIAAPTTNTPPTTTTGGDTGGTTLLVGVLVGGGLTLIVAGIVLLAREQRAARGRGAVASPNQIEIDMLVAKLAVLESERQGGKLSRKEYDKQRAVLKDQITKLMKKA